MSEEKEEQKLTMYMYVRNGKEFHTPNEQIAAQRSDTGEYFRLMYEKSDKGLFS